jgi:serine/threonine-protein phosphatase 6 regulatory ankyrin repeat subunit B
MFQLDKFKNKIFLDAARLGNTKIIEALLFEGIDVNVKDKDGWTALMWATYKCHYDIVELLLKSGVDINMKNDNGKTAFLIAEGGMHHEIAQLLKKYESTV